MNTQRGFSVDRAPAPEAVAIHLLKALTTAQREERRTDLDELTSEVGVRRAEVRRVLSELHRQGYLDVTTMRLSLAGFAIGQALSGTGLSALRAARALQTRAA